MSEANMSNEADEKDDSVRPASSPENPYRERDRVTLQILGIFFLVLGILVSLASIQAAGNTPALIVNVCSGLTLLVVGGGMRWIASRWRDDSN